MRLKLLENKFKIIIICAWCKENMGEKYTTELNADLNENGQYISHSICKNCKDKIES